MDGESEVLIINEGVNHVSDWLACPLRSHMADTLDSGKCQAVILLDITGHLTMSEPWSPGFK